LFAFTSALQVINDRDIGSIIGRQTGRRSPKKYGADR
jgi:hypothetical protein